MLKICCILTGIVSFVLRFKDSFFLEYISKPLLEFLIELFMSLFLSCIFYWIVILKKEESERKKLKKNLKSLYKEFKLRCIDVFLDIKMSKEFGDKRSLPPRTTLLVPEEFIKYFASVPESQAHDRPPTYFTLSLFFEHLETKDFWNHWEKIKTEIEILTRALNHVLTRISIHENEKVHIEFNNFFRRTYRMVKYEQDFDNYFPQRMSQIFDPIFCQPDLLEEAIDNM